jgi:hypothetical protein
LADAKISGERKFRENGTRLQFVQHDPPTEFAQNAAAAFAGNGVPLSFNYRYSQQDKARAQDVKVVMPSTSGGPLVFMLTATNTTTDTIW